MLNAMAFWAEKLGGFADCPEKIRRVLDNMPPDPPTLPQFIALCRAAPRREEPALPYRPTAEDQERARQAARAAKEAVSAGKLNGGIDTHWATHPRSHRQLDAIFGAAKNDRRYQACIDEMIEKGICTAEGKLLKIYQNQDFVAA